MAAQVDPIQAAAAAAIERDSFLYREPGPDATIFGRFNDIPTPGGLRMLTKVVECYEVPPEKIPQMDKNGIVPWFDTQGKANFEAHEDNQREHESVLDEYEQSIIEHGIVQDCRGRLFAMLSLLPVPGGDPGEVKEGFPLRLLTWGTLGRAFYRAVAKQPTHPNILASIRAGLGNICVLTARMPSDVCKFVRDYHNGWHGGAEDSFVKKLRDTREVEANWIAHQSLKCPGGAGLGNFLQAKYPGKYASANEFESAKVALHKLDRLGIFEEFCQYFGSVVKFQDRSLKTHDAILNLHQFLVVLEKVETTIDAATLRSLLFQGFALMLPINRFKKERLPGKRVPPQILDKSSPGKIKWLLTSMSDSKVFQDPALTARGRGRSRKVAGDGADAGDALADEDGKQGDEPETPAGKRRRAAKAKAVKPKPIEVSKDLDTQVDGRFKVYVEDLVSAIDTAYSSLPYMVAEDQKKVVRDMLLGLGLEFAWAGTLRLDGIELTSYSAVRKALQQHVLGSHSRPTPGVADEADVGAIGDVASSLLASLDAVPRDAQADAGSGTPLLCTLLAEVGDTVKQFLLANPLNKPVVLHAAYRAFLEAGYEKVLANAKAGESLLALMDICDASLRAASFDPRFMDLCLEVGRCLAAMQPLPKDAQDVFGESAMAEKLLQLRSAYVTQFLIDTSPARSSSNDPLSALCTNLAPSWVAKELALLDSAVGPDHRAQAWAHILQILRLLTASPTLEAVRTAVADTLGLFGLKQKAAALVAKAPGEVASTQGAKVHEQGTPGISTATAASVKTEPVALRMSFNHMWDFMQTVGSKGFACPRLPETIPAVVLKPGDLHMPYLHMLCSFLELHLYGLEFPSECRQRGSDLVLDLNSSPPEVALAPGVVLAANLKMVFAGRVTLSRSTASLLIAKVVAEGAPETRVEVGIYVAGDGLKELGCECPVLAWMVPTCADKGSATLLFRTEDAKVSLPEPLRREYVSEMTIRVPHLVPSQEHCGHSCRLAREMWPDESRKRRGRGVITAPQDLLELIGPDALAKRMQLDALASGDVKKGVRGPGKPKGECAHLLR